MELVICAIKGSRHERQTELIKAEGEVVAFQARKATTMMITEPRNCGRDFVPTRMINHAGHECTQSFELLWPQANLLPHLHVMEHFAANVGHAERKRSTLSEEQSDDCQRRRHE